jgi:NAD(P)-dependent dehydrogenase (short-subunit alcohol dehydrogenase family)
MNKQPVCIVAGVGPGMGLALARRFARGGYTVAMLARSAAPLAQFSSAIQAEGGHAHGYPVELTDPVALRAVLARIADELGDAGVAIYNASLWRQAHPMQFDIGQFETDMGLCVTGALVMAQAAWPAMQRAGKGSLLFTGGGLALHPETGAEVIALTAGKAAMRAMVLAMAPALALDGVHCSTLTVDGAIAAGGAFDPERIAERFWDLHQAERGQWQGEVVFTGSA